MPSRAETRAECERYRPARPAPGVPPNKTLEDGYRYIGDCTYGLNYQRIEESAQAKNFLKGMSRATGQMLPVYSCFRSQESQDVILCNNRCAPRFGNVECSGRIAANKSEHTEGVAADFRITVDIPNNSPHPVMNVEIEKLCRMLETNRSRFAQGRGGITLYGIGPDSVAGLHYDTKPDWCNWGACEKIGDRQILGEGHCKRKKYEDKEARLEQGLAAAKTMRLEAEIARIQAELVRLRADCKPGDLSCRDSFKN